MGMPEFIVPVDEHDFAKFSKICEQIGLTPSEMLARVAEKAVQEKRLPLSDTEIAATIKAEEKLLQSD